MRVRYTSRAFSDLTEIYGYVSVRNPAAAGKIVTTIRTAVEGLTVFPERGRGTDEPNVRVLLAGRFPYRIYYRVGSEEVLIIHIRHAARKDPEPGTL